MNASSASSSIDRRTTHVVLLITQATDQPVDVGPRAQPDHRPPVPPVYQTYEVEQPEEEAAASDPRPPPRPPPVAPGTSSTILTSGSSEGSFVHMEPESEAPAGGFECLSEEDSMASTQGMTMAARQQTM